MSGSVTGTGITDRARYDPYIQESNSLLGQWGGGGISIYTLIYRGITIKYVSTVIVLAWGRCYRGSQRQITLMNQGGSRGGGDVEVLEG